MQVEDVKARINRISAIKSVKGVIVTSRDGLPIETTLDNTATSMISSSMIPLEEMCNSMVRDVNPKNSLLFMRVRTTKFEIMMGKGDDYYTLVLQQVHASAAPAAGGKKAK